MRDRIRKCLQFPVRGFEFLQRLTTCILCLLPSEVDLLQSAGCDQYERSQQDRDQNHVDHRFECGTIQASLDSAKPQPIQQEWYSNSAEEQSARQDTAGPVTAK